MKFSMLPALLCAALLSGCATSPRPPALAQSASQPVATSTTSSISQIEQINQIQAIKPRLDTLVDANVRTLLVLDIDDTLLTSDTFFGSDRWYEWQRGLPVDHPGAVLCRFDFIALNYEAGTQSEVEKGEARFVNGLKLPKLLLTSRGADYRGATERELRIAGYTLPSMLTPRFEGYRYPAHPGLDKPVAAVSYANGIAMTTGRDKGEVLLDLLARTRRNYQAVVLVDDGIDNIRSLANALGSRGIDYYGFHYTAVHKQYDAAGKLVVSADEEHKAVAAVAAWEQLMTVVYPSRSARLQKSDKRDACGY